MVEGTAVRLFSHSYFKILLFCPFTDLLVLWFGVCKFAEGRTLPYGYPFLRLDLTSVNCIHPVDDGSVPTNALAQQLVRHSQNPNSEWMKYDGKFQEKD